MHNDACGCSHSEASTKPAGSCCKGEDHKSSGQCCKDKAAVAEPVEITDSKQLFAYIQSLDPTALTMRYRRGIEAIDRRVFEMTEDQIDTAFLPDAGVGAWPARVLIGHVADAELVFVERMRRAVGEDNPVVSVWDENAYIDNNIYNNGPKTYVPNPDGDHARVMAAIGGPLAVIHTLRQWHGQWLLSLPADKWNRKILHPQRGEQTLKNVLEYATWHLEHHAVFLGLKVEKILGPAPSEEESQGGCGSGCGCH